jgi:hypothetical protein
LRGRNRICAKLKKYLAVPVAMTRAGNEEDQLILMLAPAHGIETGIAQCGEERSVLVFGVLALCRL